ncbi:hypothetical protein L2E82_23129 [Cichorium intybus]|uniref:Uncharacterized protein n=1 Tax=Cichorium intybus TaxID=13427 RepID=A0ACB9DZF6_CICIN|nr:hypothetical protein L2E82_23129 [Cichorium intybus]
MEKIVDTSFLWAREGDDSMSGQQLNFQTVESDLNYNGGTNYAHGGTTSAHEGDDARGDTKHGEAIKKPTKTMEKLVETAQPFSAPNKGITDLTYEANEV